MTEDQDLQPRRATQETTDSAQRTASRSTMRTRRVAAGDPNNGATNAQPRRRRVFIVADETPAPRPERNSYPSRQERPDRPYHEGANTTHRRPYTERNNEQRSRYEERYQAEREGGNYSYNYNRSERPQGAGAGKKFKKGGKPQGKKPAFKKPRPFQPPTPIKYQEVIDPSKDIRLNKYLANAGVCSRREADELIAAGEITVNGQVVTELGSRVTYADEVLYKGKPVSSQSKVYILLNKPKNCVTTSDDPECRTTVMDIIKGACEERIYPVGRLDRNTTGVILITNDGDLSAKLTHPSFMKKKIYHVWLDKPVSMEHMQQIAEGIELEDGEIHADALSYVNEEDLSQVGIEIHSGRNRIVRRIFEHLGYHVYKLDRVYFAGLTKKNLPRGRWRYLTEQEVNNLRMGSFE